MNKNMSQAVEKPLQESFAQIDNACLPALMPDGLASESNEDAVVPKNHLMPRQAPLEQERSQTKAKYDETVKLLSTLEQQETSTFAPNFDREAP